MDTTQSENVEKQVLNALYLVLQTNDIMWSNQSTSIKEKCKEDSNPFKCFTDLISIRENTSQFIDLLYRLSLAVRKHHIMWESQTREIQDLCSGYNYKTFVDFVYWLNSSGNTILYFSDMHLDNKLPLDCLNDAIKNIILIVEGNHIMWINQPLEIREHCKEYNEDVLKCVNFIKDIFASRNKEREKSSQENRIKFLHEKPQEEADILSQINIVLEEINSICERNTRLGINRTSSYLLSSESVLKRSKMQLTKFNDEEYYVNSINEWKLLIEKCKQLLISLRESLKENKEELDKREQQSQEENNKLERRNNHIEILKSIQTFNFVQREAIYTKYKSVFPNSQSSKDSVFRKAERYQDVFQLQKINTRFHCSQQVIEQADFTLLFDDDSVKIKMNSEVNSQIHQTIKYDPVPINNSILSQLDSSLTNMEPLHINILQGDIDLTAYLNGRH
jgi:hypothetical protein